jgi:hypothetical protein
MFQDVVARVAADRAIWTQDELISGKQIGAYEGSSTKPVCKWKYVRRR